MDKNVKMIVVGAAWYGDWAKLYYQACVRAGLETEIVYSNFLPAQLGGSNEKAVSLFEKWKVSVRKLSPGLFIFLKRIRQRIADIELLMRVGHPSEATTVVTFIWTPGSLWVVKKLKKRKKVKLALWLGEPVERNPQWEPTFDYFDAMFMIDEGNWLEVIHSEEHRKRMGLIPLSSDQTFFHPLAEKDPKYKSDVVFIGKYLPARGAALAKIKDRDLKVYGYGWETGFKDFPWLEEKYKGVLPLSDSNAVYNGAKIAIGTLWFHKEKFVTMTQRTLDIALAGTFQASEDIPLTQKLFGEAVVYFKDADELKKAVEYYLGHEAERLALAERSRTIALGYTYDEAVKKILSACGL
jgi:spore maturation protein CgeB